jgi:hypothetical protein
MLVMPAAAWILFESLRMIPVRSPTGRGSDRNDTRRWKRLPEGMAAFLAKLVSTEFNDTFATRLILFAA